MAKTLQVIFNNITNKIPNLKNLWVLSVQIFKKTSHLAPAAIIERGSISWATKVDVDIRGLFSLHT
jgi:hypothetical protein